MIPTFQQPRQESSWTTTILWAAIAVIAVQYVENQRLREYTTRLEAENRELRGGARGLVRLIDDLRQLFTDNGIAVRK